MGESTAHAYGIAQDAISKLKCSVRCILTERKDGMTNAQIGRSLGIYGGHVGHEGHISRTILAMMEAEGVVHQDEESKRWSIRDHEQE